MDLNIRLGITKHRTLSGQVLEEKAYIKRETPKAVLLVIEKRGKASKHWIPKSLCTISEKAVVVADWFYEKEIGQ